MHAQLDFKSPNDPEASVCVRTKVKFGHMRSEAPEMHGVFCTKAIRAGEFICSWGGVTVFDSDRQPLHGVIQNYYDVTQYILQHKVGRRIVATCPRLDVNGGPRHPESKNLEDADRGTALFMNEPSKNEKARLTDEDAIVIEKVEKGTTNRPNVCLTDHRQPDQRLQCMLLYASRDISVGEELVWFYGQKYHREGAYRKSIDMTMKTVCAQGGLQPVTFREPIPISEITPTTFLIDDGDRGDEWARQFERMIHRTVEYLGDMQPGMRDVRIQFEASDRVQRDCKQFDKLREAVDDARQTLFQTFAVNFAVQTKKRANESKMRTIYRDIFDTLTEKSEFGFYLKLTEVGKKFCLDQKRGYTLINEDDETWADVLVMQTHFWRHMRNPITGNASNTSYPTFASRVLDPDVYTGIFFENNDYTKKLKETCQTWNTEDFRSGGRAAIFEMFHAMLDLRKLAYDCICAYLPNEDEYADVLRRASDKMFALYHELIDTNAVAISPEDYELFKNFVRKVEKDAEQFEKDLRSEEKPPWPPERYNMIITLNKVSSTGTLRDCLQVLYKPPRNRFAPALEMLYRVKRARTGD